MTKWFGFMQVHAPKYCWGAGEQARGA